MDAKKLENTFESHRDQQTPKAFRKQADSHSKSHSLEAMGVPLMAKLNLRGIRDAVSLAALAELRRFPSQSTRQAIRAVPTLPSAGPHLCRPATIRSG